MIDFKILKKSKKSRARLGILKTPHGEVETPAIVTVATQATVKAMTSEEVAKAGSQLLIANTFHLHLKPGEKIVKDHGGIHKFMNWKKPLMTDSGGFQVFSLGFGKEFGTGKILNEKEERYPSAIKAGQQSKLLKINEDGVTFTSYLDGKQIFLGPKESIRIQEKIGADMIFAFDECTSPLADFEYTKASLDKTHRWAKICLKTKKTDQALFGIVQGGKFKDLRIESAQFTNSLDFDGFGIGGEFGGNKRVMTDMLDWVIPNLAENKPRHLLGIGHLEDIQKVIESGIDTFDCIVPTHYARHGTAFTSSGMIDLTSQKILTDKKPIDSKCDCEVCAVYSRGYLAHLMKAKEITPLRLITFHNIYFFNKFVADIRKKIKKGEI